MAGMFKPTPSLNSRIEARLRGWRGPAVTILRRESKRTDPLALSPPFLGVPHHETPRGLPTEQAHKMMGLPMQDILEMRGGTRRTVEEEDLLQQKRVRGLEKPQPESLELKVAKNAQKARSQGPYRRRVGNADMAVVQKVNPMRYKPPATNYWRHSIYAYNKETTKNLPSATVNSNHLIRAYFNMVPKEDYAGELLSGATAADGAAVRAAASGNATATDVEQAGSLPTPINPAVTPDKPSADASSSGQATRPDEKVNRIRLKEHKTSETRIYIADRGYMNKGMIRQDVLGKISRRMQPKTAFHYPYRDIQAASAQITYKHWRNGVGVSVHVHEGEEEVRAPRKRN